MFKPHPMKKVIIAGSKDLLEGTIDALFKLRNLHLMDFKADDLGFKIGTPTKEAGVSSENLLKLRNATKVLAITDEAGKKYSSPENRLKPSTVEKSLKEMITAIDQNIMTKWEEKNELDNRIRDLDRILVDMEPFVGLPVKIEDLEPYKNLTVLLGTVKGDPTPSIQSVTRDLEIFTTPSREGLLIALFVDKKKVEAVSKILVGMNFTEMRPPEGKGFVSDRIGEIREEKAAALKKLSYHEDELVVLRKKHAQLLLASEEHLRIKVEKAEAPMRFATSVNSFVIEGFLPAVSVDRLKKELNERSGKRLYIEAQDPGKDDDIPVAMNNKGPARPFEVMTDLISRPNYKEVDPTFLMFIGLPLMFGIMLGDIGYGLVIIACYALGIFTKMFNFLGMTGATKQLNTILLYCGISSTIFGVLFNELFGFEIMVHSHLHHGVYVLLPNVNYPEFTIPRILMFGPTHFPVIRFDNIIPLLKTCVWIGLGHVFIGNVIGFKNIYIKHGFKHALFEKGSWLFIIIGGIITFYLLLRDLTGYVHLSYADNAMIIGLIILIIGCVLLIAGEGLVGLVHLPSVISNSMSYARILAIGLSSAGIALAFNNMALMAFDEGGGGMLIFGWVILFFGHFINTLLGILGPGLHSLRLHYVEFYVKFYEGGGTPYNPFGILRRFTLN